MFPPCVQFVKVGRYRSNGYAKKVVDGSEKASLLGDCGRVKQLSRSKTHSTAKMDGI